MRIRIIGVEDCPRCRALRESYAANGQDFEYWDADADEHEAALDAMGVDNVPVVQILSDDGKVLFGSDPALYPHGLACQKLKQIMTKLESKR